MQYIFQGSKKREKEKRILVDAKSNPQPDWPLSLFGLTREGSTW